MKKTLTLIIILVSRLQKMLKMLVLFVRKLCLNYFPVSRLIWKMKTVHINVSDKVSQTHNYLPWPAPLHTDEQTKQIVLRITINITMKLIEIQATPALMRSKNMKHHFLENISGYILIQRKVLVISCSSIEQRTFPVKCCCCCGAGARTLTVKASASNNQ